MRRKKYEDEYDYDDYGYAPQGGYRDEGDAAGGYYDEGGYDDGYEADGYYDEGGFSEEEAAYSHAEQLQARQRQKKRRKRRTVTLVIVVLLALLVVEFTVLMNKWVTAPELNKTLSDGNTEDDVVPANTTAGHRDDCYTFLIAGKDKAAGLTDTVMVGMLDTTKKTLRFVSIPRDTAVNVSYSPKKINQYYAAAVNNGKDGVEALIAGVEKLVGYRVDSYAIFDVDVFVELVDTMGGVNFDVPIDMDYDDPAQDLYIHVKKGYQKLSGYDTMCVFRYRSTYANGDIGRLDVQHDLLKAIASQCLSLGNIPNIKKLVDIYEENVITNLSAGNVMFYVQEFLKLDEDNISFETIPANYSGTKNGISYVFIYLDQWLEYVNAYLNPYDSEVTKENVDILYEDANGNVVSTTGTIAGSGNW